MRERLQLPLPIWSVQYGLLGGHRRTFLFALGFAGLITVGAFALRRAMVSSPLPSAAGYMLLALSAIQIAIVVLGGCNAVYRAMLRDYETKMVESHRLTPMSNIGVCLGYLFGATIQILALFLVGVLAGVLISIVGSAPVEPLLQGNLLFLSGAVSLWSAVMFSGMRLSKPISPAPFLIGFATLFTAIVLLPGAGLLLSVYSIGLGFWVIAGLGTTPDAAVIIIFLVNVLFAVFWVMVAAVKYRRPDLPAMNGWRGLLFLTLWLLVATGGIAAFDRVKGTSLGRLYDSDVVVIQWVATLILSLAFAAVVTLCTAECRCLIREGRSPRSRWDRIGEGTVALGAVVLICAIMAAVGRSVWTHLVADPWLEADAEFRAKSAMYIWGLTVASLVLGLLIARGVFLLVFGIMRAKAAWIVTGIVLAAGWAGPPVVDSVRANAMTDLFAESLEYSPLFNCSPPGLLIAAWGQFDVSPTTGLVVLSLLAALLTFLARTPREAKVSSERR
jgi:hypothetical protein